MFDHKLITFLTVAKVGSYTKAAEELYISQPAVSQQLKNLEEELNVKLFTYKKRKLHLTQSGKQLLLFVESLRSQSNKFKEHLHAIPKNKRPLHLAATQSLTNSMLPDLISFVNEQHSEIILHCDVMNTKECLDQLHSGKLDFALVEGNFDTEQFTVQPLIDEPFIAVASPKLGLDPNREYKLTELLNFPLIYRESGSGSYAIMQQILGTQNLKVSDFDQRTQISNPETIKQVLEMGTGISFMYRGIVARQIHEGSLMEVKLHAINITHPIYLVYLNNNYFEKEYLQLLDEWLPTYHE